MPTTNRPDSGDLYATVEVQLPKTLTPEQRTHFEALAELGDAGRVAVAAEPGEHVDGLAAGELRPELDVAGHVGDATVELDGVVDGVPAEDGGLARVRVETQTPKTIKENSVVIL